MSLMLHDRGRINLLEPGRLHGALAFARASTKQLIGPSGALQIIPTGVPGFGYNPDGSYGGLTMEAGATNLLLNTDAPATQSYTTTAIEYTVSFTGTGSVVLSGAYAATVTGTGATVRTALTFTSTAAALTLTLSGSVTDLQLETGANATSYISSGGTQGTRAADSATIATLSAIRYNAAAGTMVLRGVMPKVNQSNTNVYASFGDGTSQNRLQIECGTAGMTFLIVSANVLVAALLGGNPAPGTPFALACAWAAADFAVSMNGGTVALNAAGALPTISRFDLGNNSYSATNPANQFLKSLAYYPMRRPNADLLKMSV